MVSIARVLSEYVQTVEMVTWEGTLLMRCGTLDPDDWGHLSQPGLIKTEVCIQYIIIGWFSYNGSGLSRWSSKNQSNQDNPWWLYRIQLITSNIKLLAIWVFDGQKPRPTMKDADNTANRTRSTKVANTCWFRFNFCLFSYNFLKANF